MRNTFKVKFYCRASKTRKDGKAPVEVSLSVNGNREMFQLPKSCEPDRFSKLPASSDVRIYCHNVEDRINAIYTALTVADEPVSAYIIKDIFINGARKTSYTLDDMFTDGLKLKASQNATLHAYRKYVCIMKKFYEITGFNKLREASSVTHGDILTVRARLEAKRKPQTVQKDMVYLKYFFSLAFNSGHLKHNPFAAIKIPRARAESVFLTDEELNAIRELQITNDAADRVRDAFMFMAQSGLEYADMVELKPGAIQEYGNLNYIRGKRVKTGVEYIAVLYGNAREIYDFYDGKIPLLSNQKMNKHLKDIATAAGITKNVTTLTARHTYATHCLNRGLSLDVVGKMLGHVPDTRQTSVYAKLLDTSVLDANTAVFNGDKDKKGIITPQVEIGRVKRAKKWQEMDFSEDDLEWFKKELGI